MSLTVLSVSYTHLDVYKRQVLKQAKFLSEKQKKLLKESNPQVQIFRLSTEIT